MARINIKTLFSNSKNNVVILFIILVLSFAITFIDYEWNDRQSSLIGKIFLSVFCGILTVLLFIGLLRPMFFWIRSYFKN